MKIGKNPKRDTHDEFGREIGDPTPVEVPLAFRAREPHITQLIKQYVRQELSRRASEHGAETFEEANDFTVDDDDDKLPASPYEYSEMQEEHLKRSVKEIADEGRAEAGARKAAEKQKDAGGVEGSGAQGSGAGESGSKIAGNDSGGNKGATGVT